jgi:salicylate biosynthesis isochorismate synthase/menaquinone-specific isochorismate synthase
VTVVDRRASVGAGTSIAAELRALLASAPARQRPLVAATRPIGSVDPIDFFGSARALDLEAALWLQPAAERSIVGIGRAWAVEPAGVDRFALGADAWRTVMADAVLSGVGEAGPTLLGGLGFTGRIPAMDDPWRPFGPASLVLPTFCVTRDGSATTLTVALAPGRVEDPDPDEVEAAWESLARDAGAREEVSAAPAPLRVVEERPDQATWERTVGLFAGAVGRGRIDKVVLARRIVFRAAGDFDVVGALRHLARTAPESTTFAFVRGGTTFIGATPERLVRTSGRSFETVAIAGSAARGRDAAEDARLATALLASEKEREEHAVVVDMLRASLTPIVEDLRIAEAPSVLPLAHLQHLMTPISGTTRDEAGLLALAGRLHPTPAVGGTPRDVALGLIEEHEAFDRGWNAGPIGWLGADGDGEMMVALRCGLVSGSEATLFAGCGIVADSDPAREWEESRLKLRTMIAALGGAGEPDR